jgi:cytochrome b
MRDSDIDSQQDHFYVWDAFVRIFHWTLVVAFATAYVIEDPLMVHVWAGYVVGGLVIARIVWGIIGSPHARFSDFAYTPSSSLRYLRDLACLQAKRYVGHSPGGSAMVFAVLVFLVATVVTGLIVYGGDQQSGPLAGMFSKDTGEAWEGVHELIANITLALVLFHLAGVALASFAHRENLIRAMITGYKKP